MFHQFHKKMTFLYTLTTGIILTLVLLIILFYNEKRITVKNEESFQTNIWTTISKLQTERSISHSWLSQMESENDLIIHIEENNIPLLYRGSWTPSTDRDTLIRRAKKTAEKNRIDTSVRPVSSDTQQSELFQIQGEHHDSYQGVVIKFPTSFGYQSLILLHSLEPTQNTLVYQRLFFTLLDVLGIFALFFVSWNFVKKSLRPLEETKEKQDAFFAAASHELRSPITVIQASANAISTTPTKALHLSANILSECRRLSKLVEDMLTLTLSNTSGWSANLAPLDMDTLLLDLFESFEPICKEKGLSLSLSMTDEPLPVILGDRERLMQLLTILLDNAVSHSNADTNSNIVIDTERSHHTISILIIDHGIGIPDEKKTLIFDHFYRADPSRGNKSHFGLGLGIALELSKLHRGNLTVSDTEGGGCTFRLALPISF
ncbi:MAG: HAMP domain-containing histidine kinase [Lachnospiraceae bacterium]|nr:HAMP domain-containing histidine kinase [Lachnospiraceae bacterium]